MRLGHCPPLSLGWGLGAFERIIPAAIRPDQIPARPNDKENTRMKRRFVILSLLGVCLASTLHAQMPAPSMSADVKQAYNQIKTNLTRAAEKMPEESYNFKPTAEQRTFGGWVGHVADSQMTTCSRITGTPRMLNAASKTARADLMAALKESFDACDAVYAA